MNRYLGPRKDCIYSTINEVICDYNKITDFGKEPENWESSWEGRKRINIVDIVNSLELVE